MKRLILAAAALILALGGFAASQVNVVPQIGVISGVISANTYSATAVGLVPAASATDIYCINGSTKRNIHLRRFIFSGSAGTAITTPVLINYNHSLDTGGTPASGKALPVATPLVPTNPASTSSAQVSYTANPTVNDASPNLMGAVAPTFALTTTVNLPVELDFGSGAGGGISFNQSIDIPKASTVVAQVCVNLNGVSISSGSLTIYTEWTED